MAIINSANEIAKKNVGSDNFSKLLEQIYSTPGSRIFEAYKRANENIKKSVGSDYLSKVLEQTYSTSGFRILETNNHANEIIKKGVGSDKLSKVLEQIYSTSRILEENKSANEIAKKSVDSDKLLEVLAAMQHINIVTYQQSFDYLGKTAPDISKNLNAIINDIENQQIECNSNAKKQYEVILLGLLTDMEALREALHGDNNDQLLSIMIFVVVSLIIYINAPSQE